MKRWIAGIALMYAMSGAAAYADTDYRCLNGCISSGKTAPVCMPQCSYGDASSSSGSASSLQNLQKKSPHAQFSAPLPANNIILSRPPVMPSVSSKDYSCFTQCQQSGFQYALCEKRCTLTPSQTVVGFGSQSAK